MILTERRNNDGTTSFKYRRRTIYRSISDDGAAWFRGAWSKWTDRDRQEFIGAVSL